VPPGTVCGVAATKGGRYNASHASGLRIQCRYRQGPASYAPGLFHQRLVQALRSRPKVSWLRLLPAVDADRSGSILDLARFDKITS
jgi:hypothetical protein